MYLTKMVEKGRKLQIYTLIFVSFVLFSTTWSKETKENDKKEEKNEGWKKKNIQDYSDADMERLFNQWEDNDEDELEEDELPEWKREPPKIDMSKLDPSKPEEMLKMSKKGRTLMMFATVSGDPTEKETEKITSLWHTSLFNAHIETQRYVVGSNRVIFMLTDGSKAWEVKDFLINQERCEEVSIEGKSYPGKASTKKNGEDKTDSSTNKIKTKSKSDKKNNKKSKETDPNINDNRANQEKKKSKQDKNIKSKQKKDEL